MLGALLCNAIDQDSGADHRAALPQLKGLSSLRPYHPLGTRGSAPSEANTHRSHALCSEPQIQSLVHREDQQVSQSYSV